MKLLSKTLNTKFTEYKGNAIRISGQTPYSVDEVVIGVPNKHHDIKITTFRDSKNNIFERVIDNPEKPLINRLYKTTHNVVGDEEFVTSSQVDCYTLPRDFVDAYKEIMKHRNIPRTALWYRIYQTVNHLAENINIDYKVLSQVKISVTNKASRLRHSFTEFPHIVAGKVSKTKRKFLKFEVNENTYKVRPKSFYCSEGVTIPKDDTYLPYRALSVEDMKVPISQKFLKDRGIADIDISIEPRYNPISEQGSFSAIFDASDGSLNFNQDHIFLTKGSVVSSARHEVEHGWQFYLEALLMKGDTPWQCFVSKLKGDLTDSKLIQEAKDYHESIVNYVPFHKNFEAYQSQLIERLARTIGIATEEDYYAQSSVLRSNFPHIPKGCL